MKSMNNILLKFERILTIVIFSILVIVGALQIVSRSLNHPISWTEEFSRYAFVWLVFISASIVTSADEHFKIDVLNNKLSDENKKRFDILIKLLIIIFCIIQVIYGFKLASVGFERISPTMKIPMGYIYMIIPITGALSLIHTITNLININKGGKQL